MDTFSKLMFVSLGFLFLGIIILIVQAIRHKRKIIGGICILLAVLSFGGACVSGMFFDGGSPSIAINIEDELEGEVWGDVSVYCTFNYKDVKHVSTNVSTIRNDGDIYYVYGKVTIQDNYNDKYSGNFEGTYRLSGNEFSKIDLNIETPRAD